MNFVKKMERMIRDLERLFSAASANELRNEAQKVYTTADFLAFKTKYTILQVQASYARQVIKIIDRQLRNADVEKKEDLFSTILHDDKQGINRALESFDPEKASLSCKLCEQSSSEIIDSDDFYLKDGKKYHKKDDGELVCKSLNSWIIDFIYYPTKGPDKDAMKRSRYREYSCPKCGTPVIEKTKSKEEEMTCEHCSTLLGVVTTFMKSDELKSRKSYYNTEVFSISTPLSGDEDGPTFDELLFDNGNDAEEGLLRVRLNELVNEIQENIPLIPLTKKKDKEKKSGIFKDCPEKEAEVFRHLVPEDFLLADDDVMKMSETDFHRNVPKSTKALGLIIAGKAGYIFPYAVCMDCGKKYDLGKNWEQNFEILQKQGCTNEAIEHRVNWTDQVYDAIKAVDDPSYQHRIGYERALESGSNSNVVCDFKKTTMVGVIGSNYEERRLKGQNVELHSYTNGFSNLKTAVSIPLPTGYRGKKEKITQYVHQAANRWMGKLRQDCPKCRVDIEDLVMMGSGKGRFTCPHCGYSWNLREGEFLQRIKTNPYTNKLYKEFMGVLRDILKLRMESKDPIICTAQSRG